MYSSAEHPALVWALTDSVSRAAGLVEIEVPQWMIDVAVDDIQQAFDRLDVYDKYFADGVGGEA